ncbi:MAG: hypothetical protein NVS2B14_04850 [Chamaesiphon sp.]
MVLPLRNSRIRLSQGQIFWRELGEGSALVFLHGSWSNSSQWISVIEHLSKDYHCFAPDLLGFGDSERPNLPYSIDLEVKCLAEFLETLKLHQVYLIGHSLGGWIAASYALKYLDRVRGMVLLAPEGLADEKIAKDRWWTRWLLGCPDVVFWLLQSLQPLTKNLVQQEEISQLLQLRQQVLEQPITYQLYFQRSWSEIQAELLQERLEYLKVPILILQGGQDTSTAIARSRTYVDLLPTAQMRVIGRGNHNLPEEFPLVVAQFIQEFIDSCEPNSD